MLSWGLGAGWAAAGLFATSKFDVTDLALAGWQAELTDRTELASRRYKSVQIVVFERMFQQIRIVRQCVHSKAVKKTRKWASNLLTGRKTSISISPNMSSLWGEHAESLVNIRTNTWFDGCIKWCCTCGI